MANERTASHKMFRPNLKTDRIFPKRGSQIGKELERAEVVVYQIPSDINNR